MAEKLIRKFLNILADERGSQNAKSAIGILFFFLFVGGGALLNSSALPLSYNIAFGNTGSSGSGGGGGGGAGGGGYSYSPRTRARIDYIRLTVHYDNAKKETKTIGSISNDVSVGGVGWIYPENTGIEDGSRSQAELQFGESSYYLRPQNFGFAIPAASNITGVTLEIKRSAEGPDVIRDSSVRLFVGGKPTGTDRAAEEIWPAQDAFKVYGGASDRWNAGLSVSDINNSSFGVVIAARNGTVVTPTPTIQTTPASTVPAATTPAAATKAPETDMDIESLALLAKKERRGANVILLQNALIRAARGAAAKELSRVGATGYYGPLTEKALTEWRGIDSTPPPTSAQTPTAPQRIAAVGPASADAEAIRLIPTPLIRNNKGDAVTTLQKLIIKWNAGPAAQIVAIIGATGIYGPLTERAVAELQTLLIDAIKGPDAWRLAQALLKYPKGSWGDATKAAAIEYLGSLR